MKLSNLIDRHKRYYKNQEKRRFDRARRYYRGDFWSAKLQGTNEDASTSKTYLYAKNITYAIADSAVSSLLGPNPQAAAVPRNPSSEELAPQVDGLMTYTFDQVRMRRKSATALIDCVLCGRAAFKTGWNADKDRGAVTVVDPSMLFFDMTVRDVEDISYWIETTVLPFDVFQERVADGTYSLPPDTDIQPDRYPKWLVPEDSRYDVNTIRDAFKWITVYEYYDARRMTVQHYVHSADAIVMEEPIEYIPYSLFSLNQNSVDCTGLSEIQLVLDQQKTINDLGSHLKNIAYLAIPRILYNKGVITEEDLNDLVAAATGAYVGIELKNPDAVRNLDTAFANAPQVSNPEVVPTFIDRAEQDAAFVSALAEAARGQVAGVRTATEMAIIDSQLRTRLATREGHLNDAIEDVARKLFFLTQKYMQKPKQIRITGKKRWAEVSYATLDGVEVDFKMVSYNPIKKNPAVMAETIIQMLPFLETAPEVDRRKLVESVITGLGFPSSMMRPEEEVAAEREAAAQAEQQAALGGAAAGAPAIAADAMAADAAAGAAGPPVAQPGMPALPPEIQTLLDAGVPEAEIAAALQETP